MEVKLKLNDLGSSLEAVAKAAFDKIGPLLLNGVKLVGK